MSTGKEKTETGGGDSPVLFGPSNDPRISENIDDLTGDALNSAIARLEAFSDNVFGEEDDEDPFPNGIKAEAPVAPAQLDAPGPDLTGSGEGGEDGLDRILDELSDEEVLAEVPVSPAEPEGIRSLQDLAQMQEAEAPAPTAQRSPIADVLAGSLTAVEEPDDTGYLDPGFSDPSDNGAGKAATDEADYDPLGDVDIFAGYDDDPSELLAQDPDLPDEESDPDFFDDVLSDPDDEAGDPDQDAQSESSYALPEPSPYGDQDMMGGAYGYDEDEPEPSRDAAEQETAQDMLEDWPMPEEKDAERAAQPIREPAAPASSADQGGAGKTRTGGSDLDDLITGLVGGAQSPRPRLEDAADQDAGLPDAIQIPAFLRRDKAGLPRTGVLSGASSQEDPAANAEPANTDEELLSGSYGEPVEEEAETTQAPSAKPERAARKRVLAGVATLALLVAAGVGAYVMMPGMLGQSGVTEAPSPAIAPLADMAQLSSGAETDRDLSEAQTPFEMAELLAPADPMDVTAPEFTPEPDPFVDAPFVEAPVPPEVSDLLAELSREAEAPAPVGVSAEELGALETRLAEMERARTEAETRASELTEELTSLTDQITGLLQRDSDQAERLERMERLIRGQSAILAQFGQMEESLEQTQVVLLDVSARIGAVEGQNPADRDAVNRALSDVEERIQALTANMSILARMSIEGVDALRAPSASSGRVGVQTAPAAQDGTGGSDTVFQSETGGFRITSDPAGQIEPDVKKDDFVEGYGYVLDVLPASDGQRLVIMENGSVLIPSGD